MRGVAVPPPYRVLSVGGALLVAAPEAVELARRALEEAGSFHAFAAGHPEREVLRSRRGPAYAVPAGEGRWVVRHYRRGGALTRWLSDRYLRVGVPRPVRELRVSHGARERGVETPEVLALAVYPSGPFYRADLVTAYVPRSTNLAQALFEPGLPDPEERTRALSAAGGLIRRAHERGVVHVDLTLQNVLLEWSGESPRAHLLDLDGCRLAPGALPEWRRRAMLRRFERSLRGWEERAGRALAPAEREAFRAGYENGAR